MARTAFTAPSSSAFKEVIFGVLFIQSVTPHKSSNRVCRVLIPFNSNYTYPAPSKVEAIVLRENAGKSNEARRACLSLRRIVLLLHNNHSISCVACVSRWACIAIGVRLGGSSEV